MKKKIIVLGTIFLAAVGGIAMNESSSTTMEADAVFAPADCRYSQCTATAKSTGKRCRRCVSNDGDAYCWQHRVWFE